MRDTMKEKNGKKFPFISIITVNYNGKKFLSNYFSALNNINYPKDKYEVIMVDNASSDGSIEYLKENFSWVKVIENSENLGFAGGNNIAMRQAKGDYIVLLNNDTKVDNNWLLELVKVAQMDERIGICGSKILFYTNFLNLVIESDTFNPAKEGFSRDKRDLGVTIKDIKLSNFDFDLAGDTTYGINYLEGFYGQEELNNSIFRWTKNKTVIRLPIFDKNTALYIDLKIGAFRPEGLELPRVKFSLGGETVKICNLSENGFRDIRLKISKEIIKKSSYKLINNAGSIVFDDGYGADRGFREVDLGQFDNEEEVFSICGASAMYRKKMLNDVGHLDEDFFMYYEDTDLAWRSRLKGWKCYYVPRSIVYHIHCGSSIEWSPAFIYHAERNRIYMIIKNGSIRLIIPTLLYFLGFTAKVGAFSFSDKLMNKNSKNAGQFKIRLHILTDLIKALPNLLIKRREVQKNRKVPETQIKKWMVPR